MVSESVAILDKLVGLVSFQIRREDLCNVTNAAAESGRVEEINHCPSLISELQPHVLMPHVRETPRKAVRLRVNQKIGMAEHLNGGCSDAGHCLDDGRAKRLLRQSPVVGSCPPGEIARVPKFCRDHASILRPGFWMLNVDRHGQVQAAAYAP
jgi:hypothetical protein